MNVDQVLDITREAMRVTILLAAPVLLFALVSGVIINILQAVTQLTETTLTVVPKMLAVVLAFLLFSPWMIDLISDFTIELMDNIPKVVR